MPSSYQPRQGGVIEVVSEKAMAEIVSDLNKRPASTEYVEPEDKFINEYIQQNSKRIQVVLHISRSDRIDRCFCLECFLDVNQRFVVPRSRSRWPTSSSEETTTSGTSRECASAIRSERMGRTSEATETKNANSKRKSNSPSGSFTAIGFF